MQILESDSAAAGLFVACVGGGSNSIGLFHPFLADKSVRMIGVEAGGAGSEWANTPPGLKRMAGGGPVSCKAQ
jgi:tryptophan synthase beta chain